LIGVQDFRRRIARAKAKRLAGLVQETRALEAEAAGPEILEDLVEQNVHSLLAGSKRRLWGE
jgi:hypothetical protein